MKTENTEMELKIGKELASKFNLLYKEKNK